MIKILTRCPVCEGSLKAVKLKCDTCSTVIENSFDFPKLMQLSKEQMDFVEVFIKSRGNIKDVEKELGISYPTVRAKLDQVIDLLQEGIGSKLTRASEEEKNNRKEDILKLLEQGLMPVEAAIAELEKLK